MGLEVGDTATIEVLQQDLQATDDREEFEPMAGEASEAGVDVHAPTGLLGLVVDVDEDTLTVDYDPDRAGQSLTVEVEVVEVA